MLTHKCWHINVDIPLILFVAIKKRVEALDKEEKELDLRLKQLQMKGIKIKIIICLPNKSFIPYNIWEKNILDCYDDSSSKYNTNGTYINMRCEQPKYKIDSLGKLFDINLDGRRFVRMNL